MLNKSYSAVYTPCKVNNVDRLKDIICYISSENASHGPTPEQKCSEARPKRHCSGPEQYQSLFWYYH